MVKLPYSIQRRIIWLQRIKYVQGFGIQSPSAFSFVREVINNHTHYQVYNLIDSKLDGHGHLEKKKARLLYRIIRASNVRNIFIAQNLFPVFSAFINEANSNCEIHLLDDTLELGKNSTALPTLYVLSSTTRPSLLGHFLDTITPNDILIVDDIRDNTFGALLWKTVVSHHRVSFSYDLYYLGIAFFDSRPKQNYIINF